MSLIIKMSPITAESHMKKAISYICQEWKTQGQVYSNCGCTEEEMIQTFLATKAAFSSSGKRQAYHWKFSFSKDETISAENALAFIRDWAEEYLGDDYDFVCSAHSDRDHRHMHLVFNSVSRNGKKYRYEKGDWQKVITPLTNKLADKYHTGCLKEKDSRQRMEESKVDWKEKIQKEMDDCIRLCSTYPEFVEMIQSKYGYEIRQGVSEKHGVYLTLKPPGKSKAVRSYQLDEGYMPPEIEKRLNPLSDPELSIEGKEEYKALFVKRTIWYVGQKSTFVPYKELSVYQQYHVRRMMDARRLYDQRYSSLQIREYSSSALTKLRDNARLVCTEGITNARMVDPMIQNLKDRLSEHKKTKLPPEQKKTLENLLKRVQNLKKADLQKSKTKQKRKDGKTL